MKNPKKQNERLYKRLKKQGLSDAEIAESFIFPQPPPTKEQQEEFVRLLNEIRKKQQK